ncbi:hypothetical protein ACTMTI_20935 [Nonomuraea sp. H19]|uniref:hypothetical protein n=1 Tax=Nonomuraea sp. H19 TaxID=3452206 RepID=UPI003F899AC8
MVAHQARHTLATKLLANGAALPHIKRYLGQLSERMAEHYAHVALSEIDDVLQRVWVTGPGSAEPGQLLSTDLTPLTREEAQARRAEVSRTFLYQNHQAKQLLADDRASSPTKPASSRPRSADQAVPWKDRALNAEDALKAAYTEIGNQREHISRLASGSCRGRRGSRG